ncbi:uncharacterized protein B0H18DRAFT_1103922 [Fomitopsis serialis]|uniref:uncharacterized protein n=1 Tax=Fomitopsis serialis TaxID=139415 RepID=UPI002008014B|nr:uncharacterized protein B0H18DRAFT_1103922 [Neoantrodia serialis]KAH9928196.1 hypothetical protein B0H18DRAFT_1103922 [Neoantrodia serialis]
MILTNLPTASGYRSSSPAERVSGYIAGLKSRSPDDLSTQSIKTSLNADTSNSAGRPRKAAEARRHTLQLAVIDASAFTVCRINTELRRNCEVETEDNGPVHNDSDDKRSIHDASSTDHEWEFFNSPLTERWIPAHGRLVPAVLSHNEVHGHAASLFATTHFEPTTPVFDHTPCLHPRLTTMPSNHIIIFDFDYEGTLRRLPNSDGATIDPRLLLEQEGSSGDGSNCGDESDSGDETDSWQTESDSETESDGEMDEYIEPQDHLDEGDLPASALAPPPPTADAPRRPDRLASMPTPAPQPPAAQQAGVKRAMGPAAQAGADMPIEAKAEETAPTAQAAVKENESVGREREAPKWETDPELTVVAKDDPGIIWTDVCSPSTMATSSISRRPQLDPLTWSGSSAENDKQRRTCKFCDKPLNDEPGIRTRHVQSRGHQTRLPAEMHRKLTLKCDRCGLVSRSKMQRWICRSLTFLKSKIQNVESEPTKESEVIDLTQENDSDSFDQDEEFMLMDVPEPAEQ